MADIQTRRQSARVAQKQKRSLDAPSEEAEAPSPKQTKTSTPATKPLRVGDTLPSVELVDQDGKTVNVGELRKVVIFTYPKANTPGCTRQAQCFRDASSDWKQAGYDIFGLSSDSPKAQSTWAKKHALPYRLLSDPTRTVIGALTGTKASTKRSHFVVGEDGTLTLSTVGVKPGESSSAALMSVSPAQ
ncbi:peroxiredoxin Q/BCP [Malassezia restricta]|uniref:peroxiredoxin Q/BCP n=1 Tax=Malassezia restricta TaxID=76775 RepID=UPI000DD1695F|nr:peroxiredoxin Q/BCP [Malassezia restricta]AXA50778.1 peroxiredoxin Q/BCP [Malassezia restricta]